jgi:orotidine-5'-phosphate decarboxylase
MPDDVDNCVMRLANLALQAGADGLVVSPREIRALRENLGHGICLVAPGIRAAQARVDDQKRVMSPEEALEAGADYIVMGRSLLNATDPLALLDSLTE